MNTIKLIGAILTIIGAILLAIIGITDLAGVEVVAWLSGLTMLILGVGLVVVAIPLLCCCKKSKEV